MKRDQKHHTGPRSNAVDRLAVTYQQARLHTRRMHRCVALALAAGEVPAMQAALTRFRTAQAWEERTRRRYERAALSEYAWWTHGAHGAPSAYGAGGIHGATPPAETAAPSPATAA